LIISYTIFQNVSTIRELEDLIIEGSNSNIVRGKLDQKMSHFEVDYAMGRDIRKVSRGRFFKASSSFFADVREKCLRKVCRCRATEILCFLLSSVTEFGSKNRAQNFRNFVLSSPPWGQS
jgi:hypothetical protein